MQAREFQEHPGEAPSTPVAPVHPVSIAGTGRGTSTSATGKSAVIRRGFPVIIMRESRRRRMRVAPLMEPVCCIFMIFAMHAPIHSLLVFSIHYQ